jgi:hypothetical protein
MKGSKVKNSSSEGDSNKSLYLWQNKKIHQARSQLGMDLDDCRELARQISGKASISSLSLRQRWELIEILKEKGAKIYNLPLSKIIGPQKGSHMVAPGPPEETYLAHLDYWNKRFPNFRPGFASNEQLAWIKTLWELDFDDGRKGRGLRGFIFRQTKNLQEGPVSDLAFLKNHHVSAILMPLRKKANKKLSENSHGHQGGKNET